MLRDPDKEHVFKVKSKTVYISLFIFLDCLWWCNNLVLYAVLQHVELLEVSLFTFPNLTLTGYDHCYWPYYFYNQFTAFKSFCIWLHELKPYFTWGASTRLHLKSIIITGNCIVFTLCCMQLRFQIDYVGTVKKTKKLWYLHGLYVKCDLISLIALVQRICNRPSLSCFFNKAPQAFCFFVVNT